MTAAACASGGGEDETTTSPTTSPSASTSGESPPAVADLTLEPGAVGQGVPGDAVPPADAGGPGVGWTAQDGLLYVVTFGSSTCPVLAEPDTSLTDGTLSVTLVAPSDGPCTMDYVPTTSVVSVPDGVDASVPVPVDLGEGFTATLEPRPAPDEAGPIAWSAAG